MADVVPSCGVASAIPHATTRATRPSRGAGRSRRALAAWSVVALVAGLGACGASKDLGRTGDARAVTVRAAIAIDTSAALATLTDDGHAPRARDDAPPRALAPAGATAQDARQAPPVPPPAPRTVPAGSAAIEQVSHGTRPPAALVAAFDGLGASFIGPQGTAALRNPSDNSLAVGPDHIVQTVNSRMAIFTKRGATYDTTGRVLYGPVPSNNVFRGFGGPCEERLSGDAVVRYDQLADRWLVVLPIFARVRKGERHLPAPRAGAGAGVSTPGQGGQPGAPRTLYQPPAPATDSTSPVRPATPTPATPAPAVPDTQGVFAMCYAVSTSADPMGRYYRYEFVRPLFPDYPRPAVWPDGYYVPSSTGDDVIEKHACVVDRARLLAGEPATEQCVVLDDVNFLNNADLDGHVLPPAGAPNIVLATGGTQLRNRFEDDGIYAWSFHVDWRDPSRTRLEGPVKVAVAPYRYLCDGQLTSCVPQPGTTRRLDAQGDKLMARVVYRRIGRRESIVAVHSVNTSRGGGGVRWYEFRVGARRDVRLFQQGTFAPDSSFRWMASPAMDRAGNIGIGYSFGGTPHFAGQRFAGRLVGDPPGTLTLRETVLVEGEASQEHSLRWEDYTQTAVDPSDDCTIWYVGDYLRAGDATYSSRIGAFRFPGCPAAARR